jgi:hypothetical protein
MAHDETDHGGIEQPQHSADHFRIEATRLRRDAEQEKNTAVRLHLLGLALSFDGLAATVEMIHRSVRAG